MKLSRLLRRPDEHVPRQLSAYQIASVIADSPPKSSTGQRLIFLLHHFATVLPMLGYLFRDSLDYSWQMTGPTA
jgi:hypothetical protein